jgi:hypothetical protein
MQYVAKRIQNSSYMAFAAKTDGAMVEEVSCVPLIAKDLLLFQNTPYRICGKRKKWKWDGLFHKYIGTMSITLLRIHSHNSPKLYNLLD